MKHKKSIPLKSRGEGVLVFDQRVSRSRFHVSGVWEAPQCADSGSRSQRSRYKDLGVGEQPYAPIVLAEIGEIRQRKILFSMVRVRGQPSSVSMK